MSEALYRKYRPQVFGDVVGQDHIERTIRNAIEQDKVSHAYLFCGPRGTGKTTTARLLAKALLCEKAPTPEPDGTCEDCRMIAAGEHPDVYELDAASRTGVDNVREEIIGRVQFAPTRGAKKVYIIDEVHMLSTAAFNALLKTLEEPPSHIVFILCTTDPQKVPETIHSRCQRFDFRRIGSEEMVTRLGAICVAEGVEFEGDALDLIAHRAEGGMRNALTALEQAIAYGAGKVTLDVVESLVGSLGTSDLAQIVGAIGRRDVAACFTWVADYVETGADLAQFARDLAEHVRNMYVVALAGPDAPAEVSDAERREIADELPLFGPDRLARMLGVLGDVIAEFKTTTNARLSFEIALTRMVRPESDLTLAALSERIEDLERRLAGLAAGQPAVSATGASGASGLAGAAGAADAPAAGTTAPAGAAGVAPAFQPAQQDRAAGSDAGAGFAAAGAAASVAPSHGGFGAEAAGGQGSRPEQGAAQARAISGGVPEQAAAAAQAQRVAEGAANAVAERAAAASASSGSPSHADAGAAAGASALSDRAANELSNPAALQRLWQAVQAAVKREKAAYAVLLMNTRAVFDPATRIVSIEFPAESAFAFKAVQKPEVDEAVAQAFAQVANERVAFAFTQAGASAPAAAVRPAAASTGAAASSASVATQPAAGFGAFAATQGDQARREAAPASQTHGAQAHGEQARGAQAREASAAARQAGAAQGFASQEREPSAQQASGSAGPVRAAASSVQPGSAGAPAEPAPPYDDEVPVDLYDGFAYGEGDSDAYGSPAATSGGSRSGAAAHASAPRASAAAASMGSSSRTSSDPAPAAGASRVSADAASTAGASRAPETSAFPESASRDAATAAEPSGSAASAGASAAGGGFSKEDLERMLTTTFGEPVSVEEV